MLHAATPDFTEDSIPPTNIDTNTVVLKKSKSSFDNDIKYSATDSFDVDNDTRIVYLYGDAMVEYGTVTLKADYIEIDMAKNEVHAYGQRDDKGNYTKKSTFSDGGTSFESSRISYNFKSQKGKIVDVVTQQGEGYIHGHTIKRMPNDEVFISGGKYSTCSAPHPHFYFNATKIKMIKDDKIVTGPMNLVILDIPTPIMLPFGIFPNNPQHASGVLIPGYGENASQGFYLNNGGFHWAINDYMNYTVRGDIYSKGSWALRNEVNYNLRYKFHGGIKFNYSSTQSGDPDLYNSSKRNDFSFSWNHSQDGKANPNFTFNANVNFGSSKSFQNTLITNIQSNQVLNNNYNSSISISNIVGPWRVTTALNHNQNVLTNDVTIQLPSITARMQPWVPFKSSKFRNMGILKGLYTKADFDIGNKIATKDSLLFNGYQLSDMQNGLRTTVSLGVSESWKPIRYINVTLPSFSYTEYSYLNYIEKYYVGDRLETHTVNVMSGARGLQVGGIGINTQIFAIFDPIKNPWVQSTRWTMKPSITASKSIDITDPDIMRTVTNPTNNAVSTYSIFQNGLYGGPSSGKSAQINFNLENSLDGKLFRKINGRDTMVTDRLIKNLSITGSYNFLATQFKWSDFNALFSTDAFNNLININITSTLSPYRTNSLGQKEDVLLYSTSKQLVHLVTGSATASMRLASSSKKDKPLFIKIPADASINYTFRYSESKPGTAPSIIQTVQINGTVQLTDKWNIGYITGYNIQDNKMTATSFNISRDLHCWTMQFYWIPFGTRQTYVFTLQPKASLLRDVKYVKQNPPEGF
ncbi:MAG: putative LPS assembly protein LptD [Bacteroidetes bacterium]|nr:putative LPS assembly protein LptD [Bacteroidota bacterium]